MEEIITEEKETLLQRTLPLLGFLLYMTALFGIIYMVDTAMKEPQPLGKQIEALETRISERKAAGYNTEKLEKKLGALKDEARKKSEEFEAKLAPPRVRAGQEAAIERGKERLRKRQEKEASSPPIAEDATSQNKS